MMSQSDIFIVFISIIWVFSQQASAHSGRTDSNGGHYNKSTSIYHCHNEGCLQSAGSADNLERNGAEVDRYDRQDWRHWIDQDEDCQNTRAEVLISESQVGVTFATSRKCRVIKGSWRGALTGVLLSDASDVDIDHVIPLSYAHKNGGYIWSPSKKERFANDPLNLLSVYDVENRKKSDKGPFGYMPSTKFLACSYLERWQKLAIKYDLNIASTDIAVIRKIISTC